MYGRSPLSVVVVSITVRMNTCPSPEHCSWYAVITPFRIDGALQNKVIELEFLTIKKISRGGPSGTVQHIMNDNSNCTVI